MTRRCALSAPRVVLDTQVFLRGALAKTQSLTARIYDAWGGSEFVLLVRTTPTMDAKIFRCQIVARALRGGAFFGDQGHALCIPLQAPPGRVGDRVERAETTKRREQDKQELS